jgi:arsenate reductase
MTAKIYHNPRCSKSRQTLALLSENEMDVEIIEYLKTPPSRKELSDIIKMLGIKPRDLLRKGEKEYKEAGLGNMDLSDKQIIDAMLEHPRLIERPIVIKDGQARIGRPPELILEIV